MKRTMSTTLTTTNMLNLTPEQHKNLRNGLSYFKRLGNKTPEELADEMGLNVANVRRCLSLAKKFKEHKL